MNIYVVYDTAPLWRPRILRREPWKSTRAAGKAEPFKQAPVVPEDIDIPLAAQAATRVPATFTHGIVDIRASTPTLQIRRMNDQVVLSWPDWATNYTLQVCETSGTDFSWVSAMATTHIKNSESVVALPLTTQNELYRLF